MTKHMRSISNKFGAFVFDKSRFQIVLEVLIYVLFFAAFFVTIGLSYIYPFNYLNIAIYFLLSLAIVVWVAKFRFFVMNYYFVFVIFFNLAIVVSSLMNGIVYINTTVLSLTVCSFVFSQFMIEKEHRDRILVLFLLGYFAFIFYFSWYYRTAIIHGNAAGINAHFADPNVLSYTFVYGLCVMLFFTLFKRHYWMLLLDFYLIYLILLIGSRSGLILSFFAFLFFVVFFFGKRHKLWSIAIISLIVVTLVLILSLPSFNTLKGRLLAAIASIFGNGSGDNSSNHRILMAYYGIEFIIKHLAFGYGGILRFSYYNFSGQFSHNNFVEVGFNYGFFTLLLYEAFFIFTVYKLLKRKEVESRFYVIALVSFFFMQFFYPIFTNKIDYLIVGLSVSFLYNSSSNIAFYAKDFSRILFHNKKTLRN